MIIMKIQLKDREIELPDKIYLDQLIKLDLSKLETIDKVDTSNMNEMKSLIAWFLDFFKVLEIKERFTIDDFAQMSKSGKLQEWVKTLASGFQTSN